MLGLFRDEFCGFFGWRNAMAAVQAGVKKFENGSAQMKTGPVITVQVPARRMHSDDQMMYAWSIGTTRVAQERPVVRRKEECPPEVYIG
jgi:hypothetical protein